MSSKNVFFSAVTDEKIEWNSLGGGKLCEKDGSQTRTQNMST